MAAGPRRTLQREITGSGGWPVLDCPVDDCAVWGDDLGDDVGGPVLPAGGVQVEQGQGRVQLCGGHLQECSVGEAHPNVVDADAGDCGDAVGVVAAARAAGDRSFGDGQVAAVGEQGLRAVADPALCFPDLEHDGFVVAVDRHFEMAELPSRAGRDVARRRGHCVTRC